MPAMFIVIGLIIFGIASVMFKTYDGASTPGAMLGAAFVLIVLITMGGACSHF